MKRTTLATLAVFALAPASAVAEALPNPELEPIPASVALDISESLQRLDRLAWDGQDLGPELKILAQAINGGATVESMRARFMAYVEELTQRTRQTFVDQRDVALLRQQFVSVQVDHALDLLAERARGGGWTAEQYESVVAGWVARARVFVDAPDPAAYRARLMAALQTAYENAANLAEIMTAFRLQIIDARLTAAQRTVTRRAKAGDATVVDYQRALRLTIQRHRLLADRRAI